MADPQDPLEIVAEFISGGLRHAEGEALAALTALRGEGWRIVQAKPAQWMGPDGTWERADITAEWTPEGANDGR